MNQRFEISCNLTSAIFSRLYERKEPMTVVYFVRHAHSNYSPDEYNRPLSTNGLKKAQRITDRLKDQQITAIYSSPYKRAIDTVQGIADLYGKQIIVLEDLKERVLASGTLADFEDAIYRVWRDPSLAYQGGESNIDAQKRVLPIFYELLKQHVNSTLVIGTHGNIMTLVLNAFDTSIGLTFWRELKMPDIFKAEFQQLKLVKLERINF